MMDSIIVTLCVGCIYISFFKWFLDALYCWSLIHEQIDEMCTPSKRTVHNTHTQTQTRERGVRVRVCVYMRGAFILFLGSLHWHNHCHDCKFRRSFLRHIQLFLGGGGFGRRGCTPATTYTISWMRANEERD